MNSVKCITSTWSVLIVEAQLTRKRKTFKFSKVNDIEINYFHGSIWKEI